MAWRTHGRNIIKLEISGLEQCLEAQDKVCILDAKLKMLIRHSNGDIEIAAGEVSLELKNSGPVCDNTFQNQHQ